MIMTGLKKILFSGLVLAGLFSLGFSANELGSYYILAGLLILATISIFMKYPQLGIYLIALLFPFTYLQVIYGDLNVPYVDVVALLLFIAWFIKSLYLHFTNQQRLSWKIFPGWFLMFVFTVACVLSLQNVDSEFFYFCLKYLLRPVIFFYLMFVVLPFNIIDSFKKFYNVLKTMFVLGFGLSLMGIWSLIFPPVPGFRRVVPISIFGVYPVGTNHNQIAEVLIVLIPFAFILFWQEKNIFWKNIYLLGALLMVGVNLLTLSRSGWIALGLEMLILLWLKYRHEIKKIFTPVALYFLAILFVPASVLMYLLVQSGITESATLNRLKLIDVSFILLRQYPVFGAGVGVFTQIMAQVKWYLLEYGDVLDAHGFIFKNLAETGLVGTTAFCFLVFYFLYVIFKGFKMSESTGYSWIILGCFLAVMGIFTFQLFGTSYYIAQTWLPVGISLAALKLCKIKYLT
jgi:O-antigen ligase